MQRSTALLCFALTSWDQLPFAAKHSHTRFCSKKRIGAGQLPLCSHKGPHQFCIHSLAYVFTQPITCSLSFTLQVGFNYTARSITTGSQASAGVLLIISAPPLAVADRFTLSNRKITTFDVLSNDIGAQPGRIARIISVTPSSFQAGIKIMDFGDRPTRLELFPPLNAVTRATVSPKYYLVLDHQQASRTCEWQQLNSALPA
jgi:hypothetical protein